MHDKEELYDLIEKYLDNQLKGNQLADFEGRLKTDSVLQEEMHVHAALREQFGDQEDNIFRHKVRMAENRYFNSRKPKPRQALKKVYLIPTAITLLIAAIFFLKPLIFRQANDQTLFNNYFEPYENIYSLRAGVSTDTALMKALYFYDLEQYDNAIQNFRSVRHDQQMIAPFYLGVSLAATGQYDEAIEELFKIKEKEGHGLRSAAEWYICLAYLANNNQKKAHELLLELHASGNSEFQLLVNQLLEDLE